MKRMCRSRCLAAVVTVALGALPPLTAFAQKLLGEGTKDLATQIVASVSKEQKRKIAVIPFRQLDGRATVLGTYLAEELITNLFNAGNLEIVERSMLDKILSELKLGQSGAIDPNTAKQVGRVAGVDAIVTGTITDLQSYVALNCRLIDAQTGKIFAAAQTKIVKDDDLKKIMSMPMATAESGETARPSAQSGERGADDAPSQEPTKQASKPPSSLSVHLGDFIIVVRKCSASGDHVECIGFVNNRGPRGQFNIFNDTYVVDNLGNQTRGVEATLGAGQRASWAWQQLETDLPVNFSVSFRGISPSSTSVTLVMDCGSGHPHEKAVFRNVLLQPK